jgi:O-antigen/teichoic acid export membrane protein
MKNALNRFSHHTQELLSGTLIALVMKGLSALLIVVFNIMIARMLGAEETGLYFLAFTLLVLACLGSRLGLDQVLVQLVASDATSRDWGVIRGIYRKSLAIGVGLSVGCTGLLLAIAPILAIQGFGKPDLVIPLRWMSIAIVPLTVMVLHAHLMQGMKRIALYSFLQWQGVGISILTCLGLWVLGADAGLLGAVWALDGAAIAMMILSLILSAQTFPELHILAHPIQASDYSWKVLLEKSFPLFWVNFLNYVVSASFTAVLLGIWQSGEEVGIYSLAARTAQLASFVLVAANAIAAPKFAALYRSQQLESLALVARRTNGLALGSALPLLALFLCFPQWVMAWYGQSFRDPGAIVLQVMAVGQVVNVATGAIGQLLAMCQQERTLRTHSVLTAFLNIGLNLLLIPTWGAIGAAIADSSSMIVKNLAALYLVKKQLQLRRFTIFGW